MMISKSQPVVHDDKMGNIWATATKKATHFQSDFGGIIWNLNALLPNVNRSLEYAWLRGIHGNVETKKTTSIEIVFIVSR